MPCRKFYPDHIFNQTLALQRDKLHYIYKIILKESGYYYFGVTKDLNKRLLSHIDRISDVIHNPEVKNIQPFHKKASEVLNLTKYREIRDVLTIHGVAMVFDRDAACHLELYFRVQAKNDPLCLNAM
jgi:hypothetical protein